MKEAKLFMNGQSQAVRLPKEFRFQGNSVYVKRLGNYVVLIPKRNPWEKMFNACSGFSADFMETREQGDQPDRDELNW